MSTPSNKRLYECNESFILRFRDVAKDAYPNYEQNSDQQAILKQACLKVPYSDEPVHKVASQHDIDTLEQAAQWVQSYINAVGYFETLVCAPHECKNRAWRSMSSSRPFPAQPPK